LGNDAGIGTDCGVTSGDCMRYGFLLVNPKISYAQETKKSNKNVI
jgi:hypothetical protein